MKKNEILKKLGTAGSPGSALSFEERLACREAADLIRSQAKEIASLKGTLTEIANGATGFLDRDTDLANIAKRALGMEVFE